MKTYLALLAAALIIGLVPIFVRLTDLSPSAAAFWRMFLSVPLIACVLWCRPRPVKGEGPAFPLRAIILVGVYFALDLIFLHLSLAYASVATASLLNNLAPVFVGFLTLLAGGSLNRRYWIGLAIALAGIVLLLGPKSVGSGGVPIGEIAGVISAFFFALYIQALEKARRSAGTWAVLLCSGVVASFTLAPIALVFETNLVPVTVESWMAVLALAGICQLIGQACLVYAAAHLPGIIVSNGMLTQTVFAAAFAFLFFNEALSPVQGLGALIALLGVSIVLSRKYGPEQKKTI